jgi:digeranylgeranylglycerophospholipid reductase
MNPSLFEGNNAVDVLVVGLGPAGACGAMAAAAHGCSVLGIDRKARFGEPVQCAEFVPHALCAHGIDADAVVQDIRYMRSSLPSGEANTVRSPGLMLQRARFDRALIARAQQSGARLINAAALQQLDVTSRIAVIRTGSGKFTVKYKLLIAADGARSHVARLAKHPPLRTLRTQQYTVPVDKPSRTLEIRLSPEYPGGYGWLFPKGEVANIGVGFLARSAIELKLALLVLLRSWAELGVVQRSILSRTGGEIPVSGLRDDLVGDDILFAGDAAGLTHPITGAGIAPAVVSGEQAGAFAAEYIHGGNSKALSDYTETLRDLYGASLSRALCKRREMASASNEHARCSEKFLRQHWTGFPDYFH